jgi:hypothetical protein
VKGAGDLSGVVSTVGTVAAGITIEFQRANATLFQANGCRTSSILNQDELKMAILERHEKGDWPNDYFVITELIKAQSATIFISSGAGARVELVAEGNAGIDQFKLADLNAGLKVARSSNIGTTIVAQASLTPLFRACGIKRRLFRRPQYTQRGETETPRVPSESQPGGSGISFEELSVQDILDT